MVKHVIVWKLKATFSPSEKENAAAECKKRLESLNGKIPGMNYLKLQISPLSSSNGDMMLDSEFVDEASLQAYSTNPVHVEQAMYVRSVVENRSCFDFEI